MNHTQCSFDPVKGFRRLDRCTWADLKYPVTVHYHSPKSTYKPPKILTKVLNSQKDATSMLGMQIVVIATPAKDIAYLVKDGAFFTERAMSDDEKIEYLDRLAMEDTPVVTYRSYPASLMEKSEYTEIEVGDWKMKYKRYHDKRRSSFGEYELKPTSPRSSKIFWQGKCSKLVSIGYSENLASKYVRVNRDIPMAWDTDIQMEVLKHITEHHDVWDKMSHHHEPDIIRDLEANNLRVTMAKHRALAVYQIVYRMLDKYINISVS